MTSARVYLDHAATTPIRAEARAAVAASLCDWHNPSSPHLEGRAARRALECARQRLADALGWSGEIVFTAGATEALSIALRDADRPLVSAVEHDAVLRAAPEAAIIPVDANGRVTIEDDALTGGRVAIQHVNNETGAIQPLHDLLSGRPAGAIFVSDCAQSAGKLKLPPADLLAISAHKFGGPPGVGALLVRDLALIAAVGGQERGYRPGTENLPAILGMVAALEADRTWLDAMPGLRATLDEAIVAAGGEIVAGASERLPTIGAYRMPGMAAQSQLVALDLAGFAVSAGSACSSGSMKPGRVLPAMGWGAGPAGEVIRVSFGWTTSADDVARFAEAWTLLAGRRHAA